MERDAIIGNVTTIGKFIFCTFGTSAMASFANSSDFSIIIGAIFGLIWAFYDSKFFKSFFKRNKTPVTESDEILNDEYVTGDEFDG